LRIYLFIYLFIYLVHAVNVSKSALNIQSKFTAYGTHMKTVRIWFKLETEVPFVGGFGKETWTKGMYELRYLLRGLRWSLIKLMFYLY
jgi:hypothetical protein